MLSYVYVIHLLVGSSLITGEQGAFIDSENQFAIDRTFIVNPIFNLKNCKWRQNEGCFCNHGLYSTSKILMNGFVSINDINELIKINELTFRCKMTGNMPRIKGTFELEKKSFPICHVIY